MVIVTPIWQKLSSVEHKKMLIVKNYWQLFQEYLAKPIIQIPPVLIGKDRFCGK
jgi:hypothetical protein